MLAAGILGYWALSAGQSTVFAVCTNSAYTALDAWRAVCAGGAAAGFLCHNNAALVRPCPHKVMKGPTRDGVGISELLMSSYFSAACFASALAQPAAGFAVDRCGSEPHRLQTCCQTDGARDDPSRCLGGGGRVRWTALGLVVLLVVGCVGLSMATIAIGETVILMTAPFYPC